MTEEAHKSKKESKEEVVDTLNESEEKKTGVHEKSQNPEKGTQHFRKKC